MYNSVRIFEAPLTPIKRFGWPALRSLSSVRSQTDSRARKDKVLLTP